jgi:hypothetical protein
LGLSKKPEPDLRAQARPTSISALQGFGLTGRGFESGFKKRTSASPLFPTTAETSPEKNEIEMQKRFCACRWPK